MIYRSLNTPLSCDDFKKEVSIMKIVASINNNDIDIDNLSHKRLKSSVLELFSALNSNNLSLNNSGNNNLNLDRPGKQRWARLP